MTCVGRSSNTWIPHPPRLLGLHLRRFSLDVNPSQRKISSFHPKRRTPPFGPPSSSFEAYNLDDDLDVSFFGVRRSLSTHSPHPLYARPCTTFPITIDMTTMSRFVVARHRYPNSDLYIFPCKRYDVPSFPRRPAKASFAGQCGSYGNHK
jgi:hypothetical protein